LVVLVCLVLSAGAAPSSQAGQTPTPTNRPIPTDTPPANTFFFTTEDGVTLNGQMIGSGKTVIVFSNGQAAPKFFWLPVAQQLAGQGYLRLLYDYRGSTRRRPERPCFQAGDAWPPPLTTKHTRDSALR
jgi:hypothetical protein